MQKYLSVVVLLWALVYLLFYNLTTILTKLRLVYPKSSDFAVIGLFASVLLIGVLLGFESRISSQIHQQKKINWVKLVLVAIPALSLCLFNLIPWFISVPAFQPLPRDFSLVMGVVAGYALCTCGFKNNE